MQLCRPSTRRSGTRPPCPYLPDAYVYFWRFVVPLRTHEDLVRDLQSVISVGEQSGVFDNSGEGGVDTEGLHSFGVYFFEVELLVLGEVLHVGLEEAELAGIPVFEDHAGCLKLGVLRRFLHHLNIMKGWPGLPML